MRQIFKRLYIATTLLCMAVLVATAGMHTIGGGRWSWWQCLFHAMITLSTVGFGELPDMEHVAGARGFTLATIVFGTGSVVYFASVVTALVVEDELRNVFQKRRMKKAIDKLTGHVIVCGVGRTGSHVVEELLATRTPFVAVDLDTEKLQKMKTEHPDMLWLEGDATEDPVLHEAGIKRARGVVAALEDDKANLFVTLSARSLNGALRIIAKGVDPSSEPKLLRAGADKVVSPNMIGGIRLASEMIRPNVTEFLDIMLRDPAHVLRIEEARITETSVVAGKTLGAAGLRKVCDVLVIAVRTADGQHKFNPGAEQTLWPGSTLIVLGERDEIMKLRRAIQLEIGAKP